MLWVIINLSQARTSLPNLGFGGQPMGLLSCLFGPSSVRVVKSWSLSVKAHRPIKMDSGRSYKYVCCKANIHYTVSGNKLKVVRVALADSVVWSSRSGHKRKTGFLLGWELNTLLSEQIDELVAADHNLQRIMWCKAADLKAAAQLEKWKGARRTRVTEKRLRGKKCRLLLEAARNNSTITIRYNGGEHPGTKREIIPKEFFKVKGFRATYLLAYDFRRKSERSFDVSHIEIG